MDNPEYLAAYQAWRDAHAEYMDALHAVARGEETIDKPRMQTALAEIDRLHKDFMEKAKPFIRLLP